MKFSDSFLDEIRARRTINDNEPSAPIAQAEAYEDVAEVPKETKRQAISARRRTLMQQFVSELSDRDLCFPGKNGHALSVMVEG